MKIPFLNNNNRNRNDFIGASTESNEELIKDHQKEDRASSSRSFTMQMIILIIALIAAIAAIIALIIAASNGSKLNDIENGGGGDNPNKPPHEPDAYEWLFGRHDLEGSNSKPSDQTNIDCENVDLLDLQCAIPAKNGVSADITAKDGKGHYPDWDGFVSTFDIETCTVDCKMNLTEVSGSSSLVFSRSGPALGRLPSGEEIMIYLDQGAVINGTRSVNAYCFQRHTCQLLWMSSLIENTVNIGTGPGIIHGNHFYFGLSSLEVNLAAFVPNYTCCTDTGWYGSLSTIDGSIEWMNPTISAQRVSEGYSGAGVWFQPVLDVETDSLIVGTGNTYSRPASVDVCLAGGNPYTCLESEINVDSVIVVNRWTGEMKWSRSLQGIDTWNVDCLFGNANGNCPWLSARPDYDVTGTSIVYLKDGKKGIFAMQKSNIAWMLDFDTGDKIWNTLMGGDAGSTLAPWGCSLDYDINQVVCPSANYLHRTYKDLDGNKRCDGFWTSMDLETGEVKHITPVPSSRIGDECVDPLRDFEIDHIPIDHDPTNPNDPPIPAATYFVPYNNRTLNLAHGPTRYSKGVVYAGTASGYIYFMNHDDLSIIHEVPTGSTVYGGGSIIDPNHFAIGTGYNRIDPRFNATTGAMLLFRLP